MKKFPPLLNTALCLSLLWGCKAHSAPPSSAAEQPAGPTPAALSVAPAGRLPDLARPLAYRLALTLDPRQDEFGGQVAIDLTLQRDSEVIWLHGQGLDVERATAALANGELVEGSYRQVLESGVAELRFPRALPAGNLTLEIAYSAHFDRNLAGLFKVEERGEAYALAKSESIQARRFLPGFDEPGLKATYTMELTVPRGYQVITNSPEVSRSPAEPAMETVRFAPTRPMSTYLLSLSVGPFDVVERSALPTNPYRSRPIPVRGFTRKGRGADLNYILDITPRMVEIFEGQLQREYPFDKLDIVAAPQWPSGATELSAAITYREQRVLVGDNPAPGARISLISVHAHEIAHMWFGNLVTPPWWDDLWLKEGFASWGTPLALNIMEPEGGHGITAAASAFAAMELDSLASTRAIREPIDSNEHIRNAYDSITYRKSLGVIHMVDQYFGPEVFRPALGRYIGRFADGSADSPAFYEVIGLETRTPALAETFRSFVEQKGVPVLHTELSCTEEGAQVHFRQQRYRPLGSEIDPENTRWTVPLCLATDTGERHCEMLREDSQTVPLGKRCPAWVLPNAGGAGYYRWDLPAAQWQRLVRDFDQLTPVEALAVIDSAFAAFAAGTLDAAVLRQVVEASAGASARQVVSAPLHHLENYSRRYFTEPQQAALADWARRLYRAPIAAAEESVEPDQQILYSQLIEFMALTAKDEPARTRLRGRAVKFTGFGMARDELAMSSDLYESALTVAVQDLGRPFVEHLIDVRETIDDPRFDAASAGALGRATDPELLPSIWQYALSERMGAREAFDLFLEATQTPETGEASWHWVQQNFPAIIQKVPAQWRRRTPRFADGFCAGEQVAQLRALFDRNGSLAPGYERAFDQASEQIHLCMAQRKLGAALARSLDR